MKRSLRVVLLSLAVMCLFASGANAAAPTATTTTTHHHKAKHRHAAHKHTKANSARADVRDAQTHLIHLGYYNGKADGLMGPKTKAAVRDFQRDEKFKATGALTQ